MLIASGQHTVADLKHWARLERYDEVLARDPDLHRRAAVAVETIRRWLTRTPDAVVSTSWGKDSVVTTHLALLAAPTIPIVWVRTPPFDMPGCEIVRDTFLAQHPDARYEERTVQQRNPKRGEPGHEAHALDPQRQSQDSLAEAIREPHVHGTRAEESTARAISANRYGTSTRTTCRPILRWTAAHVFAYLHHHQLPVHPAYAMTMGGHHDRRTLRVHALCSLPPARSAVYRTERSDWEDHYFADAIASAHAQRAHHH